MEKYAKRLRKQSSFWTIFGTRDVDDFLGRLSDFLCTKSANDETFISLHTAVSPALEHIAACVPSIKAKGLVMTFGTKCECHA